MMMFVLAEEAKHSDVIATNLMPAITGLVVFVIAFVVVARLVWPKITKGLDEREQKIRDEIAAAEEAGRKANAALAEYEQNLAAAREEANQMIAKARSDAKAVADDLRSRNETDLADMKTRAARDIESAKQNAISELHAEAANLAAAVASKILQREISAGDQQRLVEESLQELNRVQAG